MSTTVLNLIHVLTNKMALYKTKTVIAATNLLRAVVYILS